MVAEPRDGCWSGHDHPIWRSGVRADLGENFRVVGEAGDAETAVRVIRETSPDLVVCDLHMPNGGGIRVARECGELATIVMLTVSEAERDPDLSRHRPADSGHLLGSDGGGGPGRHGRSSHLLLFPALFLGLTVLGFLLMGDAVRLASDPGRRGRLSGRARPAGPSLTVDPT